jgi:hypothetical protein
MVIRQESPNTNVGSGPPSQIDLNVVRRGMGQVVQLPAFENDVLHALTETGGLPSSQAENAVYVIRRRRHVIEPTPVVPPHAGGYPFPLAPASLPRVSQTGFSSPPPYPSQPIPVPLPHMNFAPSRAPVQNLPSSGNPYGSYRLKPTQATPTPRTQQKGYTVRGQSPDAMLGGMFWQDAGLGSPEIIRIPLRVYPGEHPPFSEADIILREGDIVFVESRETEFFFTGGLLGGGQYVLPQNYDLDLLEALSIVQSQVNTSFNSNTKAIGGVSALNHDVTVGASKVIILRKSPNGCEIKIEVDLYDAMRDPRERILIQPGDYVLLQYTRCEAVAAFFERHILEGAVVGAASSLVFGN